MNKTNKHTNYIFLSVLRLGLILIKNIFMKK